LNTTIALAALISPVLADFPDSSDVGLIISGIELTLNEEYSQARELYSELQTKYPRHPGPPFFIAATYQAEMKDHEDFEYEQEFVNNIELSIDLADKLRNEDEDDAWAYYFMGASNLYWALFEGRKDGKWSVAHKGIRGKNLMEKCLGIDSTMYDALAGLGSYRYWGDVKGGIFAKLPFVGGDRRQGIEDLRIAAEKSIFSGDLAQSALIYVYIEEGKYDLADSLAVGMRKKYPHSKSFLWARAFANLEAERYESALEFFDSLKAIIEQENQSSKYNLVQISYNKMLCHYNMERYADALIEIDYCENMLLAHDVRDRLDDIFDKLNDHKKKIRKILSSDG